jgi:acetyl esterase
MHYDTSRFAARLAIAALTFCTIITMAHAQAVTLSQLYGDNPAPTTLTYKTTPSGPVTMDVFNPAGWNAADRRTVIVFIHGGAWVAGDSKAFYPHARYFADRGAVSISVNYRLASVDGTGVPECLMDCKSAIRYIRANASKLGIDPQKLAVLGDSAGGHLAACLGCVDGFNDPQDDLSISAVPNAIVLCNPIVDMTDGNWIHYIQRGDALRRGATTIPPPTDAQLALARQLSPLMQVKPGQPPTLLMHGTIDHVVNPKQAQEYYDAEAQAGDVCNLVWMQGSGHAFIMTHYKSADSVVVDAISHADSFLGSLRLLSGPPTIAVDTSAK